jgi:hypothetical protein
MPKREVDSVHVHVFSHANDRSPADVLNSLRSLDASALKFASTFVGSFQVYAHTEFPTIGHAQAGFSELLWPQGVRTELSTEVAISQISAPKRNSPDFCALVRVRPQGNPFEFLNTLDDHFGELFDPDSYWYGAAVVTGRGYDLLVDLGRPSFEELMDAVANDLRAVPGLGRTDTSWADLSVNSIRLPHD